MQEKMEIAKQHENNREWEKALEIYKELSLYNDDSSILERVGWCASRLGRYKLAKEIYLKLCNKEPQIAKWYYCVGYQYYMEKQWNEAVEWYEKALHIYPDYLVVKYRYSYSLRQMCGVNLVLKKDEFWRALKTLQECDLIWERYSDEKKCKNKICYAAICFLHAKLLMERQKNSEAVFYFEKANELRPGNDDYQYQLAKALSLSGENARALEILPLNSKKYYVKELEIDILTNLKNLDEAIEKCQILLKYRKKDYLYRTLSELYLTANRLERAMEAIDAAEKLNKSNHKTKYVKARVLLDAGFYIAARQCAEKAIELKREQYQSDYIEAVELLRVIDDVIENKNYLKDNEDDLSSFLKCSNKNAYGRMRGVICKYNSNKGFGFIDAETQKYFFHISQLNCDKKATVVVGTCVEFEPHKTPKGLSAQEITIL